MRLLTAALAILATWPAFAAEFVKGDVRISQPWVRATPGGATAAAGYLTITNAGPNPDRLLGGTMTVAASLELHDTTMTGDIARMRRIDGGIALAPGASVTLKPGGGHVMLVGLKRALKAGEQIKGTLVLEKAGVIEITYEVAPIGAAGPGDGSEKHHHKH